MFINTIAVKNNIVLIILILIAVINILSFILLLRTKNLKICFEYCI